MKHTDEESNAFAGSSSDDGHSTSKPITEVSKHATTTQLYNNTHIIQDKGILSKLRNLEATLDAKLGIESQAINRVRPEDKHPQRWHDQAVMALLWASGTMQISCFATGLLGAQFGLSLGQSITITIFGTLLGGMVSGFCATLGPGTGLRQVSISRYSFGWYPSKIVAVLNVVSQIGWSSVACITGGLALAAVSDGKVSSVLGVVVIAVGSLVISFIGLRAILQFDKYAWFAFLVMFLVMYAEAGPYADPGAPPGVQGQNLSGSALTLLGIVYGSSASWSSIASDYYVHHPVHTNRWKVFVLTTLGISLPTCIGMVLGCCVGSAMMTTRPEWMKTYEDAGIGWLIQDVVYPIGFAKFLLVVLVLAGLAMNCLNMYSSALSIQQFARPAAKIPRIFWTLIVFGVIIALAIAGRDKLLTVLQNLLAFLGYWNTSFFVILCAEHVVFKKMKMENYDLDGWNDPDRLPVGIAGLSAFLVGFVGWFCGMVTTWYNGPISRMIGESGGDLGNELALVFTLVTYIPVRFLELKYVGR